MDTPPRFFLRVASPYIREWLRMNLVEQEQHMYDPINLPMAHPLAKYLLRNLVPNLEMRLLTKDCYNELMFCADHRSVPDDIRELLPQTEEERREFIAFLVPKRHYINNGYVACDESIQVSKAGTSEALKYIEDCFWCDFEDYRDEYITMWQMQYPGKAINEWNMVLDFLDFWSINPDHVDTIYRQMHRRRSRNLERSQHDTSKLKFARKPKQ